MPAKEGRDLQPDPETQDEVGDGTVDAADGGVSALVGRPPDDEPPSQTAGLAGEEEAAAAEGEEPSVLEQLGVDLTELVARGPGLTVVGWERELIRLVEILSKREHHAAILVGPDGVGKRPLVLALAEMIQKGDVPRSLQGRHVVELPFHRVLSSISQPADFPRAVFMALREAAARPGVLLFMDQLTSFMGILSSQRAFFDASYAIEMGLHQPGLFLLASAVPDLYMRAGQTHPWIEKYITRVNVPEPSRETTLVMLEPTAAMLSEYHGVEIEQEAIESAVDLSSYYIKERVLPGKAFELLDEAASKAAASSLGGSGGPVVVGESHVALALSDRVGIPPDKLLAAREDKLLKLEGNLRRRIKGQDHCIQKLADVIRVTKLGLDANTARPDGVFLFVGPPGVGKTGLARALADELYGGTSRLFEFNMARYADEDGLGRLVGLDLGELQYAGDLTSVIARHPHCVIILEQIERTHVDVAVLLMQIFRDGSVIDGRGRKVAFSDATIIMTSNSENIVVALGENGRVGFGQLGDDEVDQRIEKVRQATEKFFPPEFMEGIDEVLLFDTLSDDSVREIVRIHLDDIRERLAMRSITINVTEEALTMIAEKGHSKEHGARNLGHVVESMVLTRLARFLLANPGVRDVAVKIVEGDIEVSPAA